ncbi:MAG: S8 family serine peptidase [Lachnospiraceae bacterium]|nr:S8 family serine peptidase [bacterium]MDY5516011.1 S8 family serine peptidase [Lachnospiraceae bacterium]
MKKRRLTGILFTVLAVSAQMMPLQTVWAAQARVVETSQLLAAAVEELEDGTYVEGEALVSMEATEAAALVQEGTYRFDADVQVEAVSGFGVDEQTGKEKYIVHLTSDKYTTEELMQLALKQYYVDGVCANQYRQLYASDPYQTSQWYLNGSGTLSSGIRLSRQSVTSKQTPVIAVIDTGIDYNHPDLADSVWKNPYPDLLPGTYGYDFGDIDDDPMDSNGHGTHVSGIAAATGNNGIGITGVSKAKIMALKAVSDNSTDMTDAAIIASYEYIYDAMKAGVNVKAVNCSWGGSYDQNGILAQAINAVGELGALSVFAAGNAHVDWDHVNQALPTPYDLDSPYVVIVGASNEQDQAACYSDYGANTVDLFAPGSNMLSTYTKDTYLPGIYDSATQKQLSVYFNRFSDTSDNILPQGQTWQTYYTAQELGIPTDYTVNVTEVKNAANGYLKLNITRNSFMASPNSEVAGSIYVDVTDLNLDQNATYYVSFLDGSGSGSEICWKAENMVSTPQQSRFVEKDGRTYMRIVGLDISIQSLRQELLWYLDDIAISVADPDTKAFGAYTCLEGTSMAAPIVSGAVATLAAANPTLSAAQVRSLLMKSVRKVDSLSDKCKTGGVVDAAGFTTLATKVTLNKTSATLKYGKTLTLKAKVSPSDTSNAKVTWKSSNTKYATVNSKGVVKVKKAGIGHTVKITATTTDGSKKKAVCKIKLKK